MRINDSDIDSAETWAEINTTEGSNGGTFSQDDSGNRIFIPGSSFDDLAAGEGLTRRQLERDFRRHLDLSPSRYAGGIRLQAALRMAVCGQPLAAIAADLDFADQAHLCHAIKLHTGLTPRAIVGAARLPLTRLFLDVGEEILVVPEEPSVAAPGSVVKGHMTAREHMALTSSGRNLGAHTGAHQSHLRACAPQTLPRANACEGEHW